MKIPPREAHPGRLSSSVGNSDLKYTQGKINKKMRRKKAESEREAFKVESKGQSDRGKGPRKGRDGCSATPGETTDANKPQSSFQDGFPNFPSFLVLIQVSTTQLSQRSPSGSLWRSLPDSATQSA